MPVTLLDIITNAAGQADQELPGTDTFVPKTLAVTWANDAIHDAFRFATAGPRPLYYKATDFTLSSGYQKDLSGALTLVGGGTRRLAKFLGLELNPGTAARRTVWPVNWAERNDAARGYAFLSRLSCIDRNYVFLGSNILEIVPQEKGPGNYRVFFVPWFTQLSGDSDQLDPELEPFDDMIANSLAQKMAAKEESYERVSALKDDQKQTRQDILDSLEQDQGGPSTIIDVYGDEGL